MTNTSATTTRTIVTVEQAAELNDLFVQWYRLTHPGCTRAQLSEALRACDWANCQASAFEACKAVMTRDLSREARRAWAAF